LLFGFAGWSEDGRKRMNAIVNEVAKQRAKPEQKLADNLWFHKMKQEREQNSASKVSKKKSATVVEEVMVDDDPDLELSEEMEAFFQASLVQV
jgi:hypothetical protein